MIAIAAASLADASELKALLDGDTSLWVSPALAARGAGQWLRFHTGCHLVPEADQAGFLWIAQGDTPPALASLALGTDNEPERSATCVLEVTSLNNAAACRRGWELRGPGIASTQALQVEGLPPDFAQQWQANHACFPRGVDVYLTQDARLCALARSTALAETLED